MCAIFFIIILVLNCLSSVLPEKYNIIVIPVHIPIKETNPIYLPSRSQKNRNVYVRKQQVEKLDIESYENPTELPDIDNFSDPNDHDTERGELNADYEFQGNDKIVGGIEVDISLYPYHIAYGSNCGGAIIDNRWAITAGHCGYKPYIKAGSKYVKQGKKIRVKRGVIHPMWSKKNKEHPFDYDFQLLELAEPLKFDENIQPTKIAHIEDMIIGKIVTVTGWGNVQENGAYSNVLRAVRVPIISKENCQNVPFPYFRGGLTARMFCAGFPDGKKDACQGDSGGPAVSQGRLLGMVSFGYGCATPGSFGVYSKVAKVRGWIEEITGLTLD